MRLLVSHATTYDYDSAAAGAIQILRLTPRSHDGQHVLNWQLDISDECRLAPYPDAFGNVAECCTIDEPTRRVRVAVEGEVETEDRSGVLRGTMEPFPPTLFLRDTPLTATDAAISEFAERATAQHRGNTLDGLHALRHETHAAFTFTLKETDADTTAAEAFRSRRGVCQDYVHVFIAAARHLGIPARYVAGHLFQADAEGPQEAGHAWAEAFVPDLGWVAFDPTHDLCATEAYIRVAVGLDSLGAAPIRGVVFGRERGRMAVSVRVEQAAIQTQN